MSLIKLFFLYVKIGAILLGGGYVILPIMQREFAEKRKLISNDDLINYFALSQSLPGIIAANMTMFTGYKLRGKLGAVTAMFGVILVPFICIVLLASVINTLADNIYIQGALWGIGIAVVALIMLTVRETWCNSKRNLFFYVMFLLTLFSLLILDFSPIKAIIVYSIIGMIIKLIFRRVKQ